MGIRYPGNIGTYRHKNRFAEVRNPGQAILKIQTQRHDRRNSEEREQRYHRRQDVDIHSLWPRSRCKLSPIPVKPCGRINKTRMMITKGTAGLKLKSSPNWKLSHCITKFSDRLTTYAPKMVPRKLAMPPSTVAAKTESNVVQ